MGLIAWNFAALRLCRLVLDEETDQAALARRRETVVEAEAMDGSACFIYNAAGRAGDAVNSAAAHLATLGPAFTRERTFGLIHQGIALTHAKDIPEATAKLSEAVTLMRTHSSARLGHLLTQARKRLDPWAGNSYVRSLDEWLQAVALPAIGDSTPN
ncbi:hypothetical protein AB0K60_11965 [Thermopolyspora sp. NPDC052614]|uniref:hypothetical protein n=1 Tax=Thermopolyspora sp. NPDC052614 TaxID=3155682 RepID=UPI00341F035C